MCIKKLPISCLRKIFSMSLCVMFCSCATVSSSKHIAESLSSEKIVVVPLPDRTKIRLHQKNRMEKGHIRVYATTLEFCRRDTRRTYARSEVIQNESHLLWLESLSSAAAVGIGAFLLAKGPSYSDIPDSGDQTSPREQAQTWGGVFGVGGLLGLGHAGIVAWKNIDPAPTPLPDRIDVIEGDSKQCKKKVATNTDVDVLYDGKLMTTLTTNIKGTVDIKIEKLDIKRNYRSAKNVLSFQTGDTSIALDISGWTNRYSNNIIRIKNINECKSFLSSIPQKDNTKNVSLYVRGLCKYMQYQGGSKVSRMEAFLQDNAEDFYAIKEVRPKIDDIRFARVSGSNDWHVFSNFIENYPRNRHRERAEKIRDDLQYETYKYTNDIDEIRDFLAMYPQNRHATEARRRGRVAFAEKFLENIRDSIESNADPIGQRALSSFHPTGRFQRCDLLGSSYDDSSKEVKIKFQIRWAGGFVGFTRYSTIFYLLIDRFGRVGYNVVSDSAFTPTGGWVIEGEIRSFFKDLSQLRTTLNEFFPEP